MLLSRVKSLLNYKLLIMFRYYHYALGSTLRDLPDISWEHVLKEKSEDMIHVLQFPYNGEPPRVSKHAPNA